MTFAWQTHPGDRAGTRISFTPPLAENVPFSIEVSLPVADDVENILGGEIFSSRLPLFYWKTNAVDVQPLQRGVNNFNLPAGTTELEVGVYRNTQKQILQDEYVYLDQSHNEPILKTVIFRLRVPPGNINLPRFGDRDYEIDITRLQTRKPAVIASVDFQQGVTNAAVSTKTVTVKFNQALPYPAFFAFADAMNLPIGANSLAHLDTVQAPETVARLGILNNPANQLQSPATPPAYDGGILSVSAVEALSSWQPSTSVPYPIKGGLFGQKAFVVPVGSWGVRFQYSYDRVGVNQFIQASGWPAAWERVYLHIAKKWESGVESGRHYRDSSTEILEINYNVL